MATTINNNRYVLITGATVGIGYELAKIFASKGHNLILVSRTYEELTARAHEFSSNFGIVAIPIVKDLFYQNAAFELYNEIRTKGFIVDILVNNAGQGQYGLFLHTDINRQLDIIQLNVSSLTALTYVFMKDMVFRNEGKILQVASVASEIPGPLQAVYHATKAYVLSFTESLINELKGTNVTMTALQPGVTDTDFFNKAHAQHSKMVQDKSKMSDPADVAKDGYEALMRGDDKVVSGFKNKLKVAISNIIPDTTLAQQTRKESEEVDADEQKK